jgi:hypothetical protein
VIRAELFIGPQSFTERGTTIEELMSGVLDAIEEANAAMRLIPFCRLRQPTRQWRPSWARVDIRSAIEARRLDRKVMGFAPSVESDSSRLFL